MPLELWLLLAATVVVFVLLGVSPKADRMTWFLENFPVMVGAPLLAATYQRFPLTLLL